MSILAPSTASQIPADAHSDDRGVIAEQVVRIDVHKDRLIVLIQIGGH